GRFTSTASTARPLTCGSITRRTVSTSGSPGMPTTLLLGRFLDLFVIEVVHHHRRRIEGTAHAVVVGDIGQPLLGGELPQPRIKPLPVRTTAPAVDLVVERHQAGTRLADVVQDGRLVAAAQVEVFQPHEVAAFARAADD